MNRLTRATPWLFAALAVAFVALLATTGRLPDPAWRVVIATSGAAAALFGWRVFQMPLAFAAALTITSTRLATTALPGRGTQDVHMTSVTAFLDIGVGLTLCAILALAVTRRQGALNRRDIVDVLTIVIGASLITWLIVTNPLVSDTDLGIGDAIASSAYLPISALIMAFTINLMFTGLTRNRAMQFVVAAAAANLTGTLVISLHLTDSLSANAHHVSAGIFAAAFLLLCAGLTHRDGPACLASRSQGLTVQKDSRSRLVVMSAGLLGPVAGIALIGPTSTIDTIVRTIATIALAVSVVIRLRIAVRDHELARDTLLARVNRDDLTGLPTRTRFVECVADVLETTWRSERHPSIIQLNLDRFKNINDSLGHYDANQVLVTVAGRLSDAVATFGGTVARAGGDDFVIVDGSSTSVEDAMAHVDAIREALAEPITINESTVFVTASMGVAVSPRSRTLTAEELMRRADIATHRAKTDGRNRIAVFDDSMQAQIANRMDLEHALHGAIGRQEMRLYHQPIVDIVTGRVSGFEALMRWQRSDGTLVSPLNFISIAEETGIICELGAWALHDALNELRGWIDSGVVAPTTTMSVNVSPRQIADPNFSGVVQDALDRSGVSPHLLWLEMTESMMLEEPELAETTLRDIRQMGVRLALDDFGTGFSSLSLLQKFPIQRIKIDRAFVRGIAEHSNDRTLVRTIIAMAQSMGLDLVAEGVETVHQLRSLRDLGCDKAQGYLISHPVPADAMRSTMSALDELQSLSLFGPVDAVPAMVGAPSSPEPAHVEPVPRYSGPSIGHSSARPIGSVGGRLLGQP